MAKAKKTVKKAATKKATKSAKAVKTAKVANGYKAITKSEIFNAQLFSNDIVEALERSKLSARAVSDLTGVAATTLNEAKRGESLPNVDTFARIAAFLDQPVTKYFNLK